MKSLNPLKFFGTIVIVLSFVLVNQNSFAQKNSEVIKNDDKSKSSIMNDQKIEFQRLSSHDNPLRKADAGLKPAKSDVHSKVVRDNKRHPEEGVYSHPKNTQSKELIEKRDAYTKYFDNQDGTNTQMKGENPIHYMKDGLWLTYDETVVSEGNLYSLKSTDHPIILNGQNSSGSFILEAGKSLELLNNSQMYFYASDTENKLDASTSSISESNGFGSEIVFDNFYGGIDKKFTIKRGYLRYDYIVNNVLDVPNNADFLTFSDKYRLPKGWSVETGIGQQGDIGWKGSLNILDENGKRQLTIGLPFIYDSGDKTTSNSQEFGEYLWVQNGRDFELTLNVSTDWLTSTSRVYPLIIDPTISESDLTSGSMAKSSYVVGCEKEMALDPGGMEVTGYYCTYDITAQNWGYMSEQVSRVNFNSSLFGSGNSEGTYSYTTPTYTDLNGFPVGPVSVIWSGYRTYGGSACDTYYQVRTNWYTYLTTSAPPCSGTPNAGTATFSSLSTCSGTTITTTMAGTDDGLGITYQWFGNGAPLIGQTSAALSHVPAGTTDYFLEVTCSTSGGQAVTDPQIVEVTTCYNCPTSGNTSQLTCGATIYDDGGPNGDYSNSADGSITIYPDAPGSMVSISGSIDTESGYDVFYVYDGINTSAVELTGGLSGTGGGLSYTATNGDGALTIRLDSDGSVVRGGFEFTVSCVSTCTGTPATGTSTASAADNCSGTATTVAVSGTEVNGGISYDWESSADGSTGWTSLGGVYQSSTSQSPTSTTYYRHVTTCSNSGATSYSNVVSKTVETITAGSGGSSCGTATVDLTASTNSGTVEWYSASSGGSAVSTGNTYSVSMSSTTTYYAASSGCTGTRVAVTGSINANPDITAGSDVSYCSGLNGSLSASMNVAAASYGDCASSGTTSYETSCVQWRFDAVTQVVNNSSKPAGYTDYSSSIIAEVVPGETYPMYTYVNTDGAYTVYSRVWIDWNGNDSFDDAGEEYDLGSKYNSSLGLTSLCPLQITVPTNAVAGYVKCRVSARYNQYSTSCATSYDGETEDYGILVSPSLSWSWSPGTDLSNSSVANPTVSSTSSRTYTVTATDNNTGCSSQDDAVVTVYENPVSGSVAVTDLSVSGNSDLTEAIEADAITWTNSGTANGDIQYFYEWTDNSGVSPTGAWNAWVTSNPNVWNANSSGGNMNKTLWVKTVTTSTNGCGTSESSSTWINVRNCRAGATGASVSAGTVANMPFGETITYDATLVDGTFERFQYQWNSTSGSWSDWETSDPLVYNTDINAGQTLYVRSKIIGESVSGSPTCTDYSDAVQTFLIDCDADAVLLTNNESGAATEVTCSNTGISVTASNADSYTWSDGPSTDASREFTAAGTYTVTGAKSNGCQTTGSITITVNNTTPSVSLTNNESGSETEVTCANGEISVTASGADSYTWSDGASTDAARDLTSAATYTVTGTSSSNGCTGTAEITITEDTTPPTVVASDDASVCSGSSATITASGAATYEWDNSAGSSSSVSVSPSAQTTYTVTGTASNGCTGQDVVVISVDVAPTLSTSATVTDVSTCGESSLGVAVSANAGEGSWSNTGIGSFQGSTDASTTFQTNTFDTPMTLTWTHSTGACSGTQLDITAQFNQPVTTSLSAYSFDTECWIWGGLTDSEWSTASNWYKYDGSKWLRQSSSTPGSSDKVYMMSYANAGSLCVSNANDAVIPAASVTDLIVGANATVDLNGAISIAGDLTNNGTINYNSSEVTLNGNVDQTISGSAISFNDLSISKSGGGSVNVSAPITVRGTLTMNAGNIVNSSTFTVGVNSGTPGFLVHSSGTITGAYRKFLPSQSGSYFFPVGTASDIRDATIEFPFSSPGLNQSLTVSYVTGAPTLFGGGAYEGLPLVAEDGQLITNYDNEGHWVINPTNDDYDSDINAKLYNISLHMNNISDATDYTKARIIKSAGSNTANQHHVSWSSLTNQSVSGSNSDFTLTARSTGFSLFGGGSDNGDPLPVELVSFNGSCNDGLVELIWETASEYNSSHFDVENSRDGITWDVVKTIEAAGNSNELLTYTYADVNAHGGDNYYRLTQVDIDGTSKTYDVINVSCSQTTVGYFSIFPNPSSGSFQVILNNSDIIGDAEMNIVDTKGNSVLMKSIDVKTGINMYVVDQELAPGIYYISVKNGDKTTTVLKHSVK